jgi:predicted permease
MFEVLLQMSALLVCGVCWRRYAPGDLGPDTVRQALTRLVYYLLLPALILQVMWTAPVGIDSLRIAAVAALGVLIVMALAYGLIRAGKAANALAGAVILAAAFPNVTYLGLPVLEAAFGPWARSVAIQYDMLACTPLLMTAGVWVAGYYGSGLHGNRGIGSLLRIPPLWAMAAALLLNSAQVPLPTVVGGILQLLGGAVVPLMLLSLGMSLQWRGLARGYRGWIILVLLIQLLIYPAIVAGLSLLFDMPATLRPAVIIEAAMPCMVLGIVLCDRYKLDTAFYAAAVTVTTLASMLTLPLWLNFLL